MDFIKHETISMKSHPDFNEKWVQGIIAKDPSIIGLGDLALKDVERFQPGKGRLDLLLVEPGPDSNQRYEVELQLGATDESHIIRTIEYWDREKRKYPQYEHCAVIIAEDITSRFLNVISLFNGALPLIAIKMKLIKIGSGVTLDFTTVLDKQVLGRVEEDEPVNAGRKDRGYWEERANRQSVTLVDFLFDKIKLFSPGINLNYLTYYIGIERGGAACNFVTFKPRQKHLNIQVKLPKNAATDAFITQHDLELLDYRKDFYTISLSKEEVEAKSEIVLNLAKQAYDRYFGE